MDGGNIRLAAFGLLFCFYPKLHASTLSSMLHLTQGASTGTIVVTLYEKLTLTEDVYYKFVYTHSVTKEVVTDVIAATSDASTYPQRYNEFSVNPSVLFANKPIGEWHYKVYEQEGINGAQGNLLEQGKLFIQPSTAFTYTTPNETTTYYIPAS